MYRSAQAFFCCILRADYCSPGAFLPFRRQKGTVAPMTDQTGSIGVPGASEGVYPVLPLRDIVVFPHMIVPLFVGREKSIKALEEVMRADKQVVLVTQQNPSDDEP